MVEYPTNLPLDAVKVMLDGIKGNSSKELVIQAAYTVEGYGLGLMFPVTGEAVPLPIGEGGPIPETDEGILEAYIAGAEAASNDPEAKGAFPLFLLVPVIRIAVKLVEKFVFSA